MSTYYATTKDIPFNELVPRLAPFGITQMKIWRHPRAKRPIDAIRLTDRKTGSLWAYMNEKDGTLLRLGSHAGEGGVNDGDPKRILTAICEAFDTQITETAYRNGQGWVLVPEHQRNIERVQGSQ